MNMLFRRLKSVRLAIGLIAYLTVASILATLVPQGAAPEEYRTLYPGFLADLILQTGFDRFFGSILLFLLPSFLFFANLSACTVDRFLRELRKKGPRRHGPDVLHLGLMLLAVGAFLSASLHREETMTLVPGSRVNLPDGAVLSLTDFQFERYPDGRPKDWTSVLDLADKDGKAIKEKFELRVNSPLRYGGITFYQASYTPYPVLELRSRDGRGVELYPGEEISLGDTTYYFMALTGEPRAAETRAVIRVDDGRAPAVLRAAPGDRAGDLEVAGFKEDLATGIQAVRDPGYALVLPAMLLVALGTALTFIQKIKEGV